MILKVVKNTAATTELNAAELFSLSAWETEVLIWRSLCAL
jgi:hypothetical protein